MPELKPGETEQEWMARCVPFTEGEGVPHKQAIAICLSKFGRKEQENYALSKTPDKTCDACQFNIKGLCKLYDSSCDKGFICDSFETTKEVNSVNDEKASCLEEEKMPVEMPMYSATTFAELDDIRKAEGVYMDMQELKADFSRLSQNIMDSIFVEDKAQALSDLAAEFGQRVSSLQETKEYEPITEWLDEKAVWTTAYVNDLPDSSFLYIAPGGKKDSDGKTTPRTLRKFPYKDKEGKTDLPHLRNAISRIPQSNAPGLTAEKKQSLQDKAQKLLAKETGEKMSILETVKGWINELKAMIQPKPEIEYSQGFKMAPGPDGKDWIILWSTNAFRDRELEMFQTKAIEDYMIRHENDETKGEFWFWHLPKSKYADIKLQALVGRMFVEAGPFDDTFVGQSFKEFFKRYPSGHPIIAPEGWGASHGYSYNPDDRKDGIYEWFEKKESSVLPASVAANPYNPGFTLNIQEADVDQKRREEWVSVFGKELVDEIVTVGETKTAELEAAGVEFKGETVEQEPKEETQASETEVKEESVEPVSEEISENVAEKETPVDAISRDEIKSVLQEVVETLRAEMQEAAKLETEKQIEETIDALKEVVLEPLIKAVQELKKTEETKIAEQVAEIPTASRQTFVESILGNKQTLVDRRTSYGKDGPEETEDKETEQPKVAGVSLKLWN